MGIIRPATPGFLITLVATGLLAVVSFSVPFLKSVYFLKASLSVEGVNGSITFGTLGYCMELSNGTTCSKASVGYQLDINALLGDNTAIQIPTVLVKWITYALVLHIVALILAGISAIFGLLAHVREMSMAYCSTFVSGFAAAVAMIAFIFDLVLFFLTKSRINSVSGGSATMGIGIWLTLAAWICLFFAGCFYGLGRCCIRRRPRDRDWQNKDGPGAENGFAEQMRLDAVKAEADRKARQKQGEIGLPAFQESEQTPLTRKSEEYIEDGDQIMPYNSQAAVGAAGVGAGTSAYARRGMQSQSSYSGGYSQAPPGTRAVDAYYNASPSTPANAYPPTRQGSAHTQSASGYAASTYSYNNAPAAAAGAVAATSRQYGQYGQYGHQQQPTTASNVYGHTGGGSSYHSTAAQPYQTNYSVPTSDPFTAQPSSQPVFNPDTYNSTGYMHPSSPSTSANPTNNPYRGQSAYVRPLSPPERNYTLGGGGYGTNVVPDATADFPQYTSSPTSTYHTIPSPAPINTSVSPAPSTASPRATQHSNVVQSTIHEEQRSDESYSDSPPMYDAATSQPAGAWGAKH